MNQSVDDAAIKYYAAAAAQQDLQQSFHPSSIFAAPPSYFIPLGARDGILHPQQHGYLPMLGQFSPLPFGNGPFFMVNGGMHFATTLPAPPPPPQQPSFATTSIFSPITFSGAPPPHTTTTTSASQHNHAFSSQTQRVRSAIAKAKTYSRACETSTSSSSSTDDSSPPSAYKRLRLEPTETKHFSGPERFLAEFTETHKVKTLEFLSLGDFDMPLEEIQYLASSQPIPNNVRVTFSMFLERWETAIHYVKTDAGQVALQFDVKSMRTGRVTSKTENSLDIIRRRHKRATIICNKVFEEAWRALQGNANAKCSTKESGTLFGLKDLRMKEHVLNWYAQRGLHTRGNQPPPVTAAAASEQ